MDSPCDCISPCALAASLWQCLHPHRLSLQSGIASCPRSIPPATLALSQASECSINGTSSHRHRCCWADIVALSPRATSKCPVCHCCRTAIVNLFPRVTCKRPVHRHHWAAIVSLFFWAASKCHICHCHWAVIVALFSIVRPTFLHTRLTPVAILYALFNAFCHCHVWLRRSEGKLYVCPPAS
jgi:hypothetical protein